jgi:hypothetical protein
MTDPAVTEALDFSILPVFANAIPSEIAAFHECFNRPPTDKPPLSHRCPYADADPTDNRPDCPAATGEERRGLCSFSRSEYGAALATALDHAAEVEARLDEATACPAGFVMPDIPCASCSWPKDDRRCGNHRAEDPQARLDALYGKAICTEGTYDAHASECLTCEQEAVCAALEAAKGEK